MSPVFRHGGLRLYLLKLLDEAPRHGYDVIRLLQDRFLGVYSPSPGTIYPRLARLEEEGLVTHDVIDGKKVYRITDAGREELNRRLDDLADLEEELSASVRDIAREITRDVRETVRSMRDELTWAVREAGRTAQGQAGAGTGADTGAGASAGSEAGASSQTQASSATDAGSATGAGSATAPGSATDAGSAAGTSSATESGSAQDGASQAEAGASGAREESEAGSGASSGQQAGQRQRPPGDWREWVDWAERHDWRDWAEWARQRSWSDWSGRQEPKQGARSRQDWRERSGADREEKQAGPRDWRQPEWDLASDLERLASAFARELRGVAWQAGTLSEDAVGNLGKILTDTLNRIRTEVFRPAGSPDSEAESGSKSKSKEEPTSGTAEGSANEPTS